MTGFGAVPDELRQTASTIGDVVSGVAGVAFRAPAGDYGHAGVQAGWTDFLREMEAQLKKLRAKAEEHGESLRVAAGVYLESDDDAGRSLAGIGELIGETGDPLGGVVGGGFAGARVTGSAPASVAGLQGAASGPVEQAGIMSPERARELFPDGGSISSRLNPAEFGADERTY
ncbi:hypothetical protein [Amycolatopsis thermoflava]|uniref:hypothetical protein n=1 Tax=Amycolatopsis thermoflava TaxID=84480 RepID=UPI003EBEE055